MIGLNECIERGFIRKVAASNEKARQSVEKAKELLQEATQNLENELINSVVIVSYLSIFHAARALLFKDGFREKSHECILRFIEEKYGGKIPRKQIELLEKFKDERMHTQYDISYFPSEEDAEKMIEFAAEFIETIEQLI